MSEFKIKPFIKHLSKNKQFSVVTIVGFSIALTFVLLLSAYIKQELSVDHFHENKDRIFRLANDNGSTFCPPFGSWVMELAPEVESYTRMYNNRRIFTDEKGMKHQVDYLLADTTFFNMFSFPFVEGSAEYALQAKDHIVLSKSFADKLFPGESPLGKILNTGQMAFTVTGVIEDLGSNTQIVPCDVIMDFRVLADFWGSPKLMDNWGNCSFSYYVQAKESTDLASRSGLILEKCKEDFWLYERGYAREFKFEKLTDAYFSDYASYDKIRQNSKTMVSILLSIVVFILILSIINYINLAVAQTSFRAKETAIKKLMGSTRSGLFVQLISESVFLTFISAVIAFLLTLLLEPWFNLLVNTQLSMIEMFSVEVLLIFVAIILTIGIISGVFPAMVMSRFKPLEIVKGTFRRTSKGTYTKLLISFQYVVVIVLLVSTFTVYRQSDYLVNYDLGFEKENVIVLENTFEPEKKEALRNEWTKIPGVEFVSFVAGSPLDGGNNHSFNYEGKPVSFQVFKVDSAFYDIFDIGYTRTSNAISENGILLNEKALEVLGFDSIPVSFKFYNNEVPVLGVVDNFHFRDLHEELGMLMMQQLKDDDWPWQIVIKVNGSNLEQIVRQIKSVHADFSEGEPVDMVFVDQEINSWYQTERNASTIVAVFALLSIILSVMGLMAIATYFIQQRVKEIGIRKVNGASVGEVIMMLNWAFLKWVLVAMAFALPISYFLMNRWLESFVYRVELSLLTFVVAAISAFIIALLTISLQTRAAARRNPVESLRYE